MKIFLSRYFILKLPRRTAYLFRNQFKYFRPEKSICLKGGTDFDKNGNMECLRIEPGNL
jgi:hypothetical protein